MGDVIASREAAVGHAVHAGKTYWFCRFLAHLDAEHEGEFGRCRHW